MTFVRGTVPFPDNVTLTRVRAGAVLTCPPIVTLYLGISEGIKIEFDYIHKYDCIRKAHFMTQNAVPYIE